MTETLHLKRILLMIEKLHNVALNTEKFSSNLKHEIDSL